MLGNRLVAALVEQKTQGLQRPMSSQSVPSVGDCSAHKTVAGQSDDEYLLRALSTHSPKEETDIRRYLTPSGIYILPIADQGNRMNDAIVNV